MAAEKPSKIEQDTSPEPRSGSVLIQSTYIKPQARKTHDANVTFEEYHYYALKTREEEKHYEPPKLEWRKLISRRSNTDEDQDIAKNTSGADFKSAATRLEISDEEWANASRSFRLAGTGAAWYLITTDVLGPYFVGFAFGTLGWGPGIALFTIFGFFAGYSGYLIWKMFLGLDSYQFPCRNYGDLAFRTWGTTARYVTNVIQALALLLLLGQVVIQFGGNISQISKFRLCYIVCPLLIVIAGFLVTQIRTLKYYGLIASLAVWLNLLTIFISMGAISHSPPNYAASVLNSAGSIVDPDSIKPDAAGIYPPVVHSAGLPQNNIVGNINGLLNAVLAYGGAQLFVEFMAEMKRPRDFIKAMWVAEFFIYVVYVVYGSFVYYYQGQYSYLPSYQGVSPYGWQTAGNSITLLAGIIAAGLYGNIGIKVLYNNVLMDIFDAPPLVTKPGKLFYAALVPVWWSTAYILAASIPAYSAFVAVISASCLLNMTYTMPPFFVLAYDVKRWAIRSEQGEGFDPLTGQVRRHGSNLQRYVRGFLSGGPWQVAMNVWHVLYVLASLSMSGLGLYAAIESMIAAFQVPQVTSFSCRSPLNLGG